MTAGPISFLQKNKFHTFFSLALSAIFISILLFGRAGSENKPYLKTARKIYSRGMSEQYAFELLKKITSVGPRLTGSPQAEAAVELTRQLMEDMGLDNVHLEPTEVPHWVRGDQEEGWITSVGSGTTSVPIAAIGGSIATPLEGISAHVVEVRSFSELSRLGDAAKGKIIFFNRPMNPKLPNTFQAYAEAAIQRVRGATEAAKRGAVGALVRSLTLRTDDYPHTGLMQYDPGVTKIPAACISTRGADFLSELLKKDPSTKFGMKLLCAELKPVISHNVVGDITGSERPDEIIVVCGHLDRGGFLPLGFGVGNTQTVEKFKKWEYLFQSIGLFWLRPGGGGVDIAPLGQQGTVLIGLVPDSQRYFDVHHSGKDVIETVNPRELELGAIAMAVFTYVLSEEGV